VNVPLRNVFSYPENSDRQLMARKEGLNRSLRGYTTYFFVISQKHFLSMCTATVEHLFHLQHSLGLGGRSITKTTATIPRLVSTEFSP
jgi:hypothetical protein